MKNKIKFFTLFFVILFTPSLYSQTGPATVIGSGTIIKTSETNRFEYLISGLGTPLEASDLETLVKNRPGIIDATANNTDHTIIIWAPLNMAETDIWEILKFAGKTIIVNPKEISKFY